MTRRGRSGCREKWIRRVLLSDLSNGCTYLMLVLADRMSGSGDIAVSEQWLARYLGVHRQRVAERMAEARRRGFLQRTARSAPGRPAHHQAVLGPATRDWGRDLSINVAPARMRRAMVDTIVQAQVGIAVKIQLLAYAHMMNPRCEVYGLSREDLADVLGVSASTVAARVMTAKRAGLLRVVDGGTRARLMRYGLIPKGTEGQYTFEPTRTGGRYPEIDTVLGAEDALRVPHVDTLNARALLDATIDPLDSGRGCGTDDAEERGDEVTLASAERRCSVESLLVAAHRGGGPA